MAITRTSTHTATYTRTELIKMQVERVLVRSRVTQKCTEAILRGLEMRWIAEVSIYGLDENDECHAELFIKVDWSRNALHISAGRDTVQIDDGWQDGISAEIDLSLKKFEEFVRQLGLRRVFRTRYAPGVDRDLTNRRLGFVRSSAVRWRDGTVGTAMSIPELDEVTVGINIAASD
ncbi:hypothetical protein [Streptomyces sp. NBRC 109706]|uniref:hypothetical protein n=1 Tax=Streptomyces sp. NBRC 109706 TaxID=1550035 RepID=UPI000784367B|nr:hypothetical protein [Streptomyces sp. NBRC 109706]